MRSYPLLERIDAPRDLRRLAASQLRDVADEVRRYLIDTVSQCGGHFAAGLGATELAVALHYVYDTPFDRVLWDVGHQAYPHKVLTGRRARLQTIRHKGGLAPFPARHESEFDVFGVGHSSTAMSAALGMAIAAARDGTGRRVVAVVGDGAMSAGLAFEALNNIGALNPDLLVVLNDNDMSISEAIGAFSNYLARLLSSKLYSHLREGGKRVLRRMPSALELARRSESMMKGMVLPGTIFEELGLNYVGPIDGHDVRALVGTLRKLRDMKGPQLLHAVTLKGKGYTPAEADPIKWHGPGPFDPHTGIVFKESAPGPTYSQVFGNWLCEMAEQDPRVIGITPAMREGSGLVEFSKRFPDRYFDVGIAEQHAVTLAAGLACESWRPVVAIYSTFLQRAYDQLVHDVALQNLPVVFAIDRAGLVGGDGATHQGNFDVSYLRCVPNLTLMVPADENECRQMLFTGLRCAGPAAVRYPRGHGPGARTDLPLARLPVGEAQVRRRGGQRIALLAFGSVLESCEHIANRHDMTLVNMRFIKPLDERTVLSMAAQHDAFVTVEENAVAGGAGSAVSELLASRDVYVPVLHCGVPDRFIEHGSREEGLAAAGLDQASLERRICGWWQERSHSRPARQPARQRVAPRVVKS